MRIAIFLALMLLALGYAAWKGGAPERVMAGIALMMILLDSLLLSDEVAVYGSVDWAYLTLDLIGATATFILALFAHRSGR